MSRVKQNVGLWEHLERVIAAFKRLVDQQNAKFGCAVHCDNVVIQNTAMTLFRKPNSIPLIHLQMSALFACTLLSGRIYY